MMRITFALLLSIGTAGVALAQSPATDAGWPNRAIHFVVPLPAGAAADVIARLVGQKLSERLGQPVIIDNRPGASGAIGSEVVAKAPPDGYTLGMATSTTHVTAAILNSKLPYNPVTDFAPISLIGLSPYVLTLHPSVPAKNLSEFIALAKAKPGTINYSSVGDASLAHLAGELFSSMAGVRLNQIPYKSSTQAVTDLLEGRIEMQFGILTTTYGYIRDNKLRAIGVTTEKRVPELPEIPTLSEAGLPGFEVSLWFAAVAPAATPPAIVSRLNREINAVLSEPDVKKLLAAQMIQVEFSTPDQLGQRIRRDVERWSALASKAGLKAR